MEYGIKMSDGSVFTDDITSEDEALFVLSWLWVSVPVPVSVLVRDDSESPWAELEE